MNGTTNRAHVCTHRWLNDDNASTLDTETIKTLLLFFPLCSSSFSCHFLESETTKWAIINKLCYAISMTENRGKQLRFRFYEQSNGERPAAVILYGFILKTPFLWVVYGQLVESSLSDEFQASNSFEMSEQANNLELDKEVAAVFKLLKRQTFKFL